MDTQQHNTPNTASAPISRRVAAMQAAVDRFAADPAAKRARSLELAREHGLTHAARAIVIERDAAGFVTVVACYVPSASKPTSAGHLTRYFADDDTADCDCPAGAHGLACGHAGAALLAGRAAAAYILVRLDYADAQLVRTPARGQIINL